MLTDIELKNIINKSNLTDMEMLEIIRRYIYDMKNTDIGTINQPIDFHSLPLMDIAYSTACMYYFNKFKNE